MDRFLSGCVTAFIPSISLRVSLVTVAAVTRSRVTFLIDAFLLLFHQSEHLNSVRSLIGFVKLLTSWLWFVSL